MKLGELIAEIISTRGQQYDEEMMTGWVNEIEGQAVEQVINRAEGVDTEFIPYKYSEDADRELQIPERFRDVYLNYMFAKIDYYNQEAERYNNDVAMQDASWKEYQAWYIRNRRPKPMPRFRYR